MTADLVPFTELIAVPDTFASGLAEAEDLGDGNFRFTFYARRKSLGFGMVENEIVARLIMPSSAVLCGIRSTLEQMGVAWYDGARLRQLAH